MTGTDVRAPLPQPRGPLSGAVASTLARPPGRTHLAPDVEDALGALDEAAGYVHDGDAQLALWMLLELHHRLLQVRHFGASQLPAVDALLAHYGW